MTFIDRDNLSRPRQLAATALILLASCSSDAMRGCGCNPRPDDISARAPAAWSADADRAVDVTVTDDRGVSFQAGDSRIQFRSPGDETNWRHTQWEDLHRIEGRSKLAIEGNAEPGRLRVRLLFAPGNPQVHLSIKLRLPEGERPESAVTLPVRFPAGDHWHRATAGESSSVTPPVDLPGWRYPWLQYSPDETAPVTVTGWTGEGMRLRQRRGEHATLSLVAWRPLPARPCEADTNRHRVLEHHASVTFADIPPVTISRLPDGAAGAIVPVFLPPKSANHPPLWRGGPENATDWEERLRTLAYGHSYPDDPRFGNGGLLGNKLGATLTWPPSLFDIRSFRAFQRRIGSAPLDLAAPLDADLTGNQSDRQSARAPRVRTALKLPGASSLPACPEDDKTKQRPHVVVRDGPTIDTHLPTPLSPNSSIEEGFVTVPTGTGPVVASVAHTDGTRPSLTESLLTQKAVERIADHREVLVLGIPLIATRNPLRPAADHGLLSPERDHKWTLQSDFSSALTTLNLAADATGIDVLGVGALTEHWRRARRADLRWTQSGELSVRNPISSPVDAFTLMAPGAAPEGPDDLSKRTVGNGSAATWQLRADKSTKLTWPQPDRPALPPVHWRVQ